MSEQEIEPCPRCGEKLIVHGWDKNNNADTWACDNVRCCAFTNPIYDVKEHKTFCEYVRLGKQAPDLLRQRDELVAVAENLLSNFSDIMDADACLLSREQLVFKLEMSAKILKDILAKCKKESP